MVWAATSVVVADVTDRPASVLAHDDVVSELESGSAATPTTTTPKADTATAPSHGREPASGGHDPAVPGARSQNPRPGVSTAPFSPPAPAKASPGALPNTRPAAPPSPRPSATYSTSGGVVRVACDGFFIELISAIPTNGYAVNVVARGPANVEVHFVRSGQDLSVKAVCYGQPIRYYDQASPRQGAG